MYPDIQNSPHESPLPGPSFQDHASGKLPGIAGPYASRAIHLNGYQEAHPWICAILFDETAACGSPGYFAEGKRSIVKKMIRGTDPDSAVFSLSVPSGLSDDVRQILSRKIRISLPGTRNDVVFPVGRWSEGDMTIFPAFVDSKEQHILISFLTQVGGKVRKLRAGYLIFTDPLNQGERAALFKKMGCDPGIWFVMLEFPEG